MLKKWSDFFELGQLVLATGEDCYYAEIRGRETEQWCVYIPVQQNSLPELDPRIGCGICMVIEARCVDRGQPRLQNLERCSLYPAIPAHALQDLGCCITFYH
jgi:hypothetical protein